MVHADLQNYLKSRSDMSTLDFHHVMAHARYTLGKGGIIGITTFHDRRYEDAKKQCELQGIHVQNMDNAFYTLESDLLFVKCQRIMTKQGDLEAIGVREHHHLPEHLSLEDTLKAIEDEGALANLPAPFHQRGSGPYIQQHPKLLHHVDALTVYSGEGALWIPHLLPRDAAESPNEAALYFYREMKPLFPHLGALTASNGSSVRHIGANYTMIEMPEDYRSLQTAQDVCDALRTTLREATPLYGQCRPLVFGSLRHQFVVLVDHNPLSYALKGIPNAHLDHLFTQKE